MSDNDILTGQGARTLVNRMGEAVSNFLASLTADQTRAAQFDFADQEKRTKWYYVPIVRDGLALNEMEPHQQKLALQVVATGLSRTAFVAASTIMGLENTLDFLEGWKFGPPIRDSRLYYLAIFGSPDPDAAWGWRFGGHHISLNYTIVKGQIVAPTPTFFGSNPAEASLGQIGVLRPLGGTEDFGRDLMHALSDTQQATALLAPAAPDDIVTANRVKISEGNLPLYGREMMGETMNQKNQDELAEFRKKLGVTQEHLEALRYSTVPKGVSAQSMNVSQQEMLTSLIKEYIYRMPDELAEIEMAKLHNHGLENIHFAWAGSVERHQPHYYRLQGPRFFVEYDNTQNDANHIHSVWRDPDDDFGAQLLEQHYHHDH
ncbi:MAG: DUF3500 domain-containing protein [Chloroflexota bacterium]